MILGGIETGVLERQGEGPRLLLSHCSLAHSGAWKPMLKAMPPHHALALDLPGHGGTAKAPERSPEAQAVDALLECLELAPAHLIGHSFGGRVVLKAALARPERVLSVTAIEPMMFHLLKDVGHPAYEDEVTASARWADAMALGDFDAAGDAFTALWGTGQRWQYIPERQRSYLRACMPTVLAAGPEVMGHPDGQITLPDLKSLKMPLLLLAGEKTRHTGMAICQVLSKHTTAKLKILQNAGHMLPLTHPTETAEVISNFIISGKG